MKEDANRRKEQDLLGGGKAQYSAHQITKTASPPKIWVESGSLELFVQSYLCIPAIFFTTVFLEKGCSETEASIYLCLLIIQQVA